MKLSYTYWKSDGWYLGFLDALPGWWTQGKDKQELEIMLLDLYDLCDDEESLNCAKTTNNNDEVPENAAHGILKIPVAQSSCENLSIDIAV